MRRSHSKLSPQILDEASDWFVEFSEGNVDGAARGRFDNWLRRSPEHIQAYLKITVLWEDASMLRKSMSLSAEELIARALAETNIVPLGSELPPRSLSPQAQRGVGIGAPCCSLHVKGETGSRPLEGERLPGATAVTGERLIDTLIRVPFLRERRVGPRWGSVPAVAAVSMVLAFVGLVAWLDVQRQMYSTGLGEQRSVRLDDGTTVELNSRSRLRVRFTQNARTVELLNGQALFHVAKNPTRPFVVESDGMRVRAVGTQFDVYKHQSGTTVTVLEGRVAVYHHATEPESQRHSGLIAPTASTLDLPFPHETEAAGEESLPGNLGGGGKGKDLTGDARASGLHKRSEETQPDWNAETDTRPTALIARDDEILLTAGEQLTLAQATPAQPHRTDPLTATAWTQHKIVFQHAPLTEVVEEFNRYNAQRLVINDPTLADTRITGVFSSTNPDSLLRFLSNLPNVSVVESPSQITITRKSSRPIAGQTPQH